MFCTWEWQAFGFLTNILHLIIMTIEMNLVKKRWNDCRRDILSRKKNT